MYADAHFVSCNTVKRTMPSSFRGFYCDYVLVYLLIARFCCRVHVNRMWYIRTSMLWVLGCGGSLIH